MDYLFIKKKKTLTRDYDIQGMVHATTLSCNHDEFLCGDGLSCVHVTKLCDFSSDCQDSSDEFNLGLCKVLSKNKNRCSSNTIRCSHSCYSIKSACSSDNCLKGENIDMCAVTRNGMLSPIDHSKEVITTEFKKKIDFMHSAMKSAWKKNFTVCPIFYKEYKGLCYSPFVPIELNWTEAKLFCKSIGGQLAAIKDINDFKTLLDFLHQKGIQQNLWVGGIALVNETEWKWEDGDRVPMGVPFWSMDYSIESSSKNQCSYGTDHIDVHKEIRPQEIHRHSMCLAMMEKNFYYFSDEFCTNSLSPLCTTKPLS